MKFKLIAVMFFCNLFACGQTLDSIEINGSKFKILPTFNVLNEKLKLKVCIDDDDCLIEHFVTSSKFEIIDSMLFLKSIHVFYPKDTILYLQKDEFIYSGELKFTNSVEFIPKGFYYSVPKSYFNIIIKNNQIINFQYRTWSYKN